jgi:hypothetical protein
MPSHSATVIGVGDRPWQPNLSKSQTTAISSRPVELSDFKSSNMVIRDTEDGHIIYIDITNTGKATGSYTLNLKINGYTSQSKAVTLDPSTSKGVQWLVSDNGPGTYTVEVDGLSGTYTVDMLQWANRLINPAAVLVISALLILTSLLLAVVYVWRKRQDLYS